MSEKRKVLVVDDDDEICRGASLRLQANGYETFCAHDGETGLGMAVEHRPDVIVLDVKMPKKSGLAVLSDLKKHRLTMHIPVVMLSASVIDQRVALESGARYFLPKPYRGPTLVEAVRRAEQT